MTRLIVAVLLLLLAASMVHAEGCEVLIRAKDAPGDSSAFRWSKGDPVIARPIGAGWGRMEDPDTAPRRTFVIVTITDLPVVTANAFIHDMDEDEENQNNPRAIRAYRFLVDNLPAGVRQQLRETGRYTTNKAAIRAYIRHRRTGGYPWDE